VPINGATADVLLLTNLQAAQTGTYTVTVSNSAGSVTSAPASVALLAAPAALPPVNTFDLVGFASLGGGTTGGGALLPGDPSYRVLDASVANRAQQLRTWLESATPLVVDVQVEVDLGALNNVSARPKTNPELIASGIGVINLRSNKTVFSSTGATIRHGTFNLSGQNNIIVRNLRFRGLWEFDEGSQDPPNNSPWGYKIQDWDYIDIQNGARNVWIDHCDFEKAYDGIADTKAAADLITFSWCRLGGDTEGAVARQIAYLERLYQGTLTDSRIAFTFYKGLRDGAYAAQGIPRQSVQDIIDHELPHDKCNLVGASDTETASIGYLNMTFHHIYYHGCRQRLPRMRFGNAHVFNLFVDNSIITEGTNMATATTCDAAVFAENNYYLEVADPFPAQSGTSPPGLIAQSGCKWIYQRAEQSFAVNTFLKNPATWAWNPGTKNFTWAVAPAPNARSLPYSYQADAVDYTKNNLAYVGVIVPATATDQATLAAFLVKTAH
jgi:pectate lyase